uniref:Uncharacterized protein n=1 Tax=Glossina palpalis gambiensis TaxID=67801 RepID=A0A1B0BK18_9MUSC
MHSKFVSVILQSIKDLLSFYIVEHYHCTTVTVDNVKTILLSLAEIAPTKVHGRACLNFPFTVDAHMMASFLAINSNYLQSK